MTDIEAYGLCREACEVDGRSMIVTIDFEAFDADRMPLWTKAMRHWATCVETYQMPCCLFVALEDAVLLSRNDAAGYAALTSHLGDLVDGGCELHTHNHFMFDPRTGQRCDGNQDTPVPQHYSKRLSMFFDVVHRHRHPIGAWLTTLRDVHLQLMSDVGRAHPRKLAFRAGGWDYGSTYQEVCDYIEGLRSAGFDLDSSACHGRFGTSSWRSESPFGANTFRLRNELLEIGPSMHLNCGRDLAWRQRADLALALRRHPGLFRGGQGVLVVVLHFDHLFHKYGRSGAQENFAVLDFAIIRRRIDTIFQTLRILRSIFGIGMTTYGKVAVR